MESPTSLEVKDGTGHIEREVSTEAELKEAHRKIILNNIKIKLLKDLLGMGLCTRDVYSFACTQADLRTATNDPDWSTIKSAMKSKIRDLKQSLKEDHRRRREKERNLLTLLNGRSWKVRKKIRSIKNTLMKEKNSLQEKYKKKINHYKMTQERLVTGVVPNSSSNRSGVKETVKSDTKATVIPTIAPKALEEYSTISIFGTPEQFVKPKSPLGPYIASKEIKLNKGEIQLLARDPKFSVIYPPTRMKVAIETERMNSKVRYDLGSKKRRKKAACMNRIKDCDNNPIDWFGKDTISDDKRVEDMTLEQLFDKCKTKFVYDPVENSINFTKRKPTDYKLNKSVTLPKPLDSELELQCELRRRSYMKAFEEYHSDQNKLDKNKEKTRRPQNIVLDRKSDVKFSQKEKKRADRSIKWRDGEKEKGNSKRQRDPLNLKPLEIKAMKSLKDKIKEGEIIITQTDKSSRFAVLTKDQYLQSGHVHTKKDKKITWKEVNYLQSQVNSHVWWLAQIVGYARDTDQGRMLKNLLNHSLEVPEMSLLIKDHKSWRQDSDDPVPSRPVVSGNRGVNTHLSEILSELLEPLVLEMGGGRCHLLRRRLMLSQL